MTQPTDDTILIKGSILKSVAVILISCVFVVTFILMTNERPVLGWIGAGFFALGVPVGIMGFFQLGSLELKTSGFVITSTIGQPERYSWDDIEKFYIFKPSGYKLVGMKFRDNSDKQVGGREIAKGVSQSLYGESHEAALPNTLAIKADKLCVLMEEWRVRNS